MENIKVMILFEDMFDMETNTLLAFVGTYLFLVVVLWKAMVITSDVVDTKMKIMITIIMLPLTFFIFKMMGD